MKKMQKKLLSTPSLFFFRSSIVGEEILSFLAMKGFCERFLLSSKFLS